jgi:hypothetical protein
LEHELEALTQQIWKRLFGKFQHHLPNLEKVETNKTQKLNKANLQKTKKNRGFKFTKWTCNVQFTQAIVNF